MHPADGSDDPGRGPHLLRELWLSVASRVRIWYFYDAAVGTVAAFLGFHLSPSYPPVIDVERHTDPWVVVPAYGLLFVLMSLAAGAYERGAFKRALPTGLRSVAAAAGAWIALQFAHYAVTYQLTGRWIVLLSGAISSAAAVLPRVVMTLVGWRVTLKVVFLGSRRGQKALEDAIASSKDPHVEIVGAFDPGTLYAGPAAKGSGPGMPWSELRPDAVVVEGTSAGNVIDEVTACLESGVRVYELLAFVEEAFKKVPVECMGPDWIVFANLEQTTRLSGVLKRLMDVLFGLVGLAIVLPFWPLVALLIKLTSRGPVFYSQDRVGKSKRIFRIYKFRSMRIGAETNAEAVWASSRDPRVTLFGRFLRKTRIDEWPQFVNVLLGDMSLVGPRPERPEFVKDLAEVVPHYHLRHLVKPGITGWAQVNFHYGASSEDAKEKLRYDLYYVKHGGIVLDLRIALRTVGALFKGAR